MQLRTRRVVSDCTVTIPAGTVLDVIEKRPGTVPWRPYYVADYHGHRVAVFADEGEIVTEAAGPTE